jgi:predicted transposase YbfD/YdcC
LAGALQIARIDRRMGAQGQLHQTWLVTSRSKTQLDEKQWLDLEQQRWGIENRTHHTLAVTHREDESRVRQPNAASVLGILRRLSNALKQVWAKGRPKREATSRDWIEENQFNRWRGIRRFMRLNPIWKMNLKTTPALASALAEPSLMQPWGAPDLSRLGLHILVSGVG